MRGSTTSMGAMEYTVCIHREVGEGGKGGGGGAEKFKGMRQDIRAKFRNVTKYRAKQ